MTIVKIVFVGIVIFALMVVANDRRWAQRTGIVAVCAPTPAPRSEPNGNWYACKEGVLTGYPNLEADKCDSAGITQSRELWSCSIRLSSLPGA